MLSNLKFQFAFLGLVIVFSSAEMNDDNSSALTAEGKMQYDLIQREAKMPRYGDCYLKTLTDLHLGCAQLTDEIQSRLALSFTNCYLQRFGWSSHPCSSERSLQDCMKDMDSRSASVYSAMLTNTLAMCHFLQEQAWHKSTTDAVHSLTSASESVSIQLSHAVDSATALRQQLNSQLVESRDALKNAFSEMRESTAEQRNLIIDVFDRVAQLQSLVMGEFTWFYSVVFYVSCVLVSLVATCTPRTLAARLPLLMALASSFMVERAVTSLFLSGQYYETLQDDVYVAVWQVRQACIVVCCLLVVRAAILYRDPVAVTAARLEELTCATRELKDLIHMNPATSPERQLDISNDTLESLTREFNESASSDDTYSPTDEESFSVSFEEANQRYSLRSRPEVPVSQNPILALESPEAFERVLKRRSWIRGSATREKILSGIPFIRSLYPRDLSGNGRTDWSPYL